jgi:hypothetical protein
VRVRIPKGSRSQAAQALADIDEVDLISLESAADPKARGRRL